MATLTPTSGARRMCDCIYCTLHRAVCTPSHAAHIQFGGVSMENMVIIIICMLKVFPSLVVWGFFQSTLMVLAVLQ